MIVVIFLILFIVFVVGVTFFLYKKGLISGSGNGVTSDVNSSIPPSIPLDNFTLSERYTITPWTRNLFNEEMSREECAEKCSETEGCVGFVYNNNNGKCYGKPDNLIVPSDSSDAYTIGAPIDDPILDNWETMQDTTSLNPDVFTITDSPEVCAYKCQNDNNCGGFIYKDGDCYGKKLEGGKIFKSYSPGYKLYSKPGFTPSELTDDAMKMLFGSVI